MNAKTWLGAWALLLVVGCPPAPAPPVEKPTPTVTASATPPPPPEPTCKYDKLGEVYLTASQKVRADIAERHKRGLVPVKLEVSGCNVNLELLEDCKLTEYYSYHRFAASETKTARTKQELYDLFPLRDDGLAAKLSGERVLRSDQVMVGVYKARRAKYFKFELEGDRCDGATHVIDKIWLGGFAIADGSPKTLDGVPSLFEGGHAVISREGDPRSCKEAPSKRFVDELCSVPLKVSLLALTVGTLGGSKASCKHSLCEAGPSLDQGCDPCAKKVCADDDYCCTKRWDEGCVTKAKKVCTNPCTGSCEHDVCEMGTKLDQGCSGCVEMVCSIDSYCCNNKWDSSCVSKASKYCKKNCPTPQPKVEPKPEPVCHDVCEVGVRQKADCGDCQKKICEKDNYCCNNKWDSSCTKKVKDICGKPCPCDKYEKGVCQGAVLKYCVFNQIKEWDCRKNTDKRWCGYDYKVKRFQCVDTPQKGPAPKPLQPQQ